MIESMPSRFLRYVVVLSICIEAKGTWFKRGHEKKGVRIEIAQYFILTVTLHT